MLIHLLVHRIFPKAPITRTTYPLERLQKLIEEIGREKIILPGDPLSLGKISFAFTFDDATYDFYHYLYPWLCDKKIPVSLAIPTSYIQERSTLSSEARLAAAPFASNEAHCSWEEIKEMVASKWVYPLSHSHTHPPINLKNGPYELLHSKKTLEEKCGQKIQGFVFPYGKATRATISLSKKYYSRLFRIGSALNFSWKNISYRIPIENFPKGRASLFVKWLSSKLACR